MSIKKSISKSVSGASQWAKDFGRVVKDKSNHALAVAVCTMLSAPAMAQQLQSYSGGVKLGKMASNVAESFIGVDQAVRIILWVMGFLFIAVAVFKFKAWGDNGHQTSLKVPIICGIAGVCCVSAPLLLSSFSVTLFGGNGDLTAPTFTPIP